MSDTSNPMMDNVASDPLANSMARMGLDTEPVNTPQQPIYKAVGDSKIPVSKRRGKLWKSRRDTGMKSMADIAKAWDENLAYYNQDQSMHREGTDGTRSGSRYTARRLNEQHSITENIVYANVRSVIPELYAKNPVLDATAEPDRTLPSAAGADDDMNAKRARAMGKLVTALFRMKAKPGVNLKPVAKKAITLALLTDLCWVETGYVQKEMSSEQAYSDLADLSTKLKDAKTTQEIIDIEGKLIALEEKIDFLSPGGPFIKLRHPKDVIRDPDSQDLWLSDANWVMIADMLPTSYIKAVYTQEPKPGEEKGQRLIYEPTHIVTGKSNEDNESLSIFETDEAQRYGFEDKDSFNDAKRTKVWYAWDRVTRRLELWHDKQWEWPIWVWDDPYSLDTFFPLTPLFFHDSPNNRFSKPTVSYYLDQQDLLNEINDESKRAIHWAKGNIFFDKKRVDRKDVERILKGNSDGLHGLDVPEGYKVSDLIFSVPPPSVQFQQLFDKAPIYAAIDRIDASNEAMRGGQFKTNTTNQAIEYYSTMGNMRMDERLDAVEEMIGDIGWKIGQLSLRFMSPEMVQQITRMDVTEFWRPIDPNKDFDALSIACVGGSTQKLTGKQRKKEALDVGQILSQFSKVAPAQVLRATMTLFANAFDDMQFTKEDWQSILGELNMIPADGMDSEPSMGSVPGSAAASPAGGGSGPEQMLMMVAQVLQQLPPDALKAIGTALSQGVPPMEILKRVMQPAAPASDPEAASNGAI